MSTNAISVSIKNGPGRWLVARVTPREKGGAMIKTRNNREWCTAKGILIRMAGDCFTSASKRAKNGHALEAEELTPSKLSMVLFDRGII